MFAVNVYSFYHSTVFVLGSVLAWAVMTRCLHCSHSLKCVAALGKTKMMPVNIPSLQHFIASSSAMLKLAFNTLNHIDGRLGMTKGNHQSRKKSVKIPNNGLDRPPTEIDPF